MSSPRTDELGQRLRALVDHHVSDEARARHLAAVEAELGQRPGTAAREGTVGRAAHWRGRRLLAALAAATTVLTPGVAVAAQGAVPGDTLYSVKRATEHVHVLIAGDVIARHRVTELAALLDRDTAPSTLARAATAARDAVATLPADHPLHRELAMLLARIADDRPPRDTPPPPPADTGTTTEPDAEPDQEEDDAGAHEDETGADADQDDEPDTDHVEDGDAETDGGEDAEEGATGDDDGGDDSDHGSELEDDHEAEDADETDEGGGDTATAATDDDTPDDERDD